MHSVWFRSTFLRVLKFLEIKECGPNFWREAILQKVWIIWSPFLYFNFKSFMDPNSLSLITFSMHSAWFGSTFFRDLKFLQIKEGRGNFLGESILQKVWMICSPILYFNFKSFMEPNSLSFIRFQCILHGSRVLFLESWDFYKLKWGGPNFWGEAILQKVWIIWPTLLYFNLKSFMDPNSLSFVRF